MRFRCFSMFESFSFFGFVWVLSLQTIPRPWNHFWYNGGAPCGFSESSLYQVKILRSLLSWLLPSNLHLTRYLNAILAQLYVCLQFPVLVLCTDWNLNKPPFPFSNCFLAERLPTNSSYQSCLASTSSWIWWNDPHLKSHHTNLSFYLSSDPTRGVQATKSHLINFPVLPFQWRLIAVDWLGFLPWVPNAARWRWGHLQRWMPNKPLKKTRKRVRRGWSTWGFFVFSDVGFSAGNETTEKRLGLGRSRRRGWGRRCSVLRFLFFFKFGS